MKNNEQKESFLSSIDNQNSSKKSKVNSVHSAKWTKKEENLLLQLCQSKLRKKWNDISNIIGSKSASQCSYKYRKLKKSGKYDRLTSKNNLRDDDDDDDCEDAIKADNCNKQKKYIRNSTEFRTTNTSNSTLADFKFTAFPSISTQDSIDPLRVSKPNFKYDSIVDFPDVYNENELFNLDFLGKQKLISIGNLNIF